ncbi:carboxypeptidase-like regulatory domain-containing protein [Hymenobacter aerilatus]|uniref:Carboxypeptidase-like regulatory domain-containing protein n=1 Tax=Hymenobacter aerilatus TaxID=2932251 RepID=A0A8T9SXU6_9BACT|nr:carboxypeptidase-like regulatory domain-containing protein [Hymenobacter aerilatus]UOR05754.1 carboxypeptidase-like regulatory domain-containing protein [Hymenobacter aerilatus]
MPSIYRIGLLLLFALINEYALGQSTLSGQVLDAQSSKPLEMANVFFANTTVGTPTDAQGKFAFPTLKAGSYTLVVSHLGYQLYKQTITVADAPQTFIIQLAPTTNQLSEVVVRPHRNRPADYARFTQRFLGSSSFSKQCKIRNPDGVVVEYDDQKDVLMAYTPYQLQVDNEALGYRVTFYDLDFQVNYGQQTTYTDSQVSFQDLTPRNERQRRRWAENRQRAYQGSFMHFLRSVYRNEVAEAGFRVQRLQREENQHRAWAVNYMLTRSTLGVQSRGLPMAVVHALREPPITSALSPDALPSDSMRRYAPPQTWLRFRGLLAVTYEGEEKDPAYQRLFPGPRADIRAQRSVVQLRMPEAEVTAAGVIRTLGAVVTEGYWGFERVGELLPQDYQPPVPELRMKR